MEHSALQLTEGELFPISKESKRKSLKLITSLPKQLTRFHMAFSGKDL